jgi:hypothetical protein
VLCHVEDVKKRTERVVASTQLVYSCRDVAMIRSECVVAPTQLAQVLAVIA